MPPPRRFCFIWRLSILITVDLHENFVKGVSVDQEEVITFWKSVPDRDTEIFKRILQHCEIEQFSQFVSGKNDRIFMNILSQMYLWTRDSMLNFGSHLDLSSDLKSGHGLQIHLDGNCSCILYIHRVRKKGATLFFAITLRNLNRSSKFFYRHTQQ